MKHTTTVKAIYTAFGSFNISGIILHVADDVDWEYGGTEKIPWLTHRTGHYGAVAFLNACRQLSLISVIQQLFSKMDRKYLHSLTWN